ncbi:hypothetical protein RI129_012813 [Pyrocoelia pectoralis]|uniref:Ionotropic glutamate receptor C-terminal domain-containing protein n=1 Tax=Pyrocoelia pectoralis TaxID=417401 RepID=A0AAN7V067_9COLE
MSRKRNNFLVVLLSFAEKPYPRNVQKYYSIGFVVKYVLKELSHYLNATFQSSLCTDELQLDSLSRNIRMIVISKYNLLDNYARTEPLLTSDFLWFVPKANQISNMNVFTKVFNYDVWIATIVVFICVWLMWFLIISRNGGFTFDKLCVSFLNVWSLTICGNVVSQLPRSLALRIILLFYLIYAMQMQFAFTSDMSTVLTTPRYDFQIRNLDELADSQLPIYTLPLMKTMFFSENNTDRKLYTKLQNSIHGVTAYEIRETLITGVSTVRLQLPFDHYFTTTFNTFLSRMVESGILEKHTNDIYHQCLVRVMKVPAMAQDDELTLKHVTFIFAFLGFGLFTGCVVFCLELVLHKYL